MQGLNSLKHTHLLLCFVDFINNVKQQEGIYLKKHYLIYYIHKFFSHQTLIIFTGFVPPAEILYFHCLTSLG
jgi:hypothetical protein